MQILSDLEISNVSGGLTRDGGAKNGWQEVGPTTLPLLFASSYKPYQAPYQVIGLNPEDEKPFGG